MTAAAWMLTEIAQLVVTVIIVLGGGFLLWHGNLDQETSAMIRTLITGWSGFWLGAKVQRQLPTSTTSTTTKVGPAESTTTTGQTR